MADPMGLQASPEFNDFLKKTFPNFPERPVDPYGRCMVICVPAKTVMGDLGGRMVGAAAGKMAGSSNITIATAGEVVSDIKSVATSKIGLIVGGYITYKACQTICDPKPKPSCPERPENRPDNPNWPKLPPMPFSRR